MYAAEHISLEKYLLLRQGRMMPILCTHLADVTMEPIALTLGQQFELEQRSRDISTITDVRELQEISKDLLLAWQKEIARSRAAACSQGK